MYVKCVGLSIVQEESRAFASHVSKNKGSLFIGKIFANTYGHVTTMYAVSVGHQEPTCIT